MGKETVFKASIDRNKQVDFVSEVKFLGKAYDLLDHLPVIVGSKPMELIKQGLQEVIADTLQSIQANYLK